MTDTNYTNVCVPRTHFTNTFVCVYVRRFVPYTTIESVRTCVRSADVRALAAHEHICMQIRTTYYNTYFYRTYFYNTYRFLCTIYHNTNCTNVRAFRGHAGVSGSRTHLYAHTYYILQYIFLPYIFLQYIQISMYRISQYKLYERACVQWTCGQQRRTLVAINAPRRSNSALSAAFRLQCARHVRGHSLEQQFNKISAKTNQIAALSRAV